MNKINLIGSVKDFFSFSWLKRSESTISLILENLVWLLVVVSVLGAFFVFTNNALIGSGFVKQSIFVVAVNLALVCWLGLLLYKRELSIAWTTTHSLFFVFVLVVGLSTFLSQYFWGSLVGTTITTVNAVTVWSLFVLFFLLSQRPLVERTAWVKLILISLLVLVVLSFLQFFGWYIFPNDLTNTPAFNPLGAVRQLALMIVLLLPLGLSQLSQLETFKSKIIASVGLVIVVVFLQTVLSTVAWWLLAVVLGFWLVLKYLTKNESLQWLSVLLLGLALIMALWPLPRMLGVALPANVRMTNVLSYTIATDSVTSNAKQFFVGSGPSTFAQEFMQRRPVQLNDADLVRGDQTIELWGVRFVQPSNVVSLLLVTVGALGTVTFLVLLIWSVVEGWRKSVNNSDDKLYGGLTVAVTGFGIAIFLQSFSLPLFVTMSVLLALLALKKQQIKNYSLSVINVKTIIISLLLLLVAVVSIYTIKVQAERSVASFFAVQSLQSRASGYLEQAVNEAGRAVRLVPNDDVFTRLLVESWLNYAIQLSNQEQIDQQQLQTAVLAAIQSAARAENIDPTNGRNVAQLAFVFRQVAPFFDGAANLSVDTYARAEELEPTNPALPTERARSLITAGQYAERNAENGSDLSESELENFRQQKIAEAERALAESIALKSDYAPARFLLANIAIQQNQVASAVEELTQLQSSNPRDAGLHYQRGILLYSQNDFTTAKDAFENAVTIQPNFANARYFLGLSLAQLGETEGAIAQFEDIKRIDPESADSVDQILTNLRAGRDALSNVNSQLEESLEEPLDSEEVDN